MARLKATHHLPHHQILNLGNNNLLRPHHNNSNNQVFHHRHGSPKSRCVVGILYKRLGNFWTGRHASLVENLPIVPTIDRGRLPGIEQLLNPQIQNNELKSRHTIQQGHQRACTMVCQACLQPVDNPTNNPPSNGNMIDG